MCGDIGTRGPAPQEIVNGRDAKLRKLRTTFTTGQIAVLTCHVICSDPFFQRSLGEKYGLRIIPGKNSFLILPNNVSRSTCVGSILAPGGILRSPVSPRALWMNIDAETPDMDTDIDFVLAVSSDEKLLRRLNELDFAETVSTGDSGTGTDAKWKLGTPEVIDVLWQFANAK